MKYDGQGFKKPSGKKDNKHIGGLRPHSAEMGKGGPVVKGGRMSPLKSGKK